MSNERYEIDHNGNVVTVEESALCSDVNKIIQDLFSQYNWRFSEIESSGPYHRIRLTNSIEQMGTFDINLFVGNVRNEKRSPYEKKIQLNSKDPRNFTDGVTIILGIYVYGKDDGINDAIFVAYPIDNSIRYDTNPSLRGVFVNGILLRAKNDGFCLDRDHKICAFRAEFIFYYIRNIAAIHQYGENKNVFDGNAISANETDSSTEDSGSTQTQDNVITNLNRIYFGAPGTGKSHQLIEDAKKIFEEDNIERVTFYPNYSYAQFVGTYKPIMDGKDIAYKFVPGPFIRSWVKAYKASHNNSDNQEKFLLIIEELNRANAAAVFGDLFQLLDRLEDGSSEYPVATSEDLRQYLASEGITDNATISLPANMYIWTTMNSADQGVFPLDTAFRRRWDCKYLGIDTNEDKIIDKEFKVDNKRYLWNDFRKAINKKLLDFKVNEDKLIGPFYVKPEYFSSPDAAADVIKDKVLMYLYEDAGRQFRNAGLFAGCDIKDNITYSAVCNAFDIKGGEIFGVKHISSGADDIDGQNQIVVTNNSIDDQSPSDRTLNIYRSILFRLFAGVGLSDSDDRKSQESQDKIRTYIQDNQQNPNTRGQWSTAYNYFLQHPDFLNEGEDN